MFLAACGGLLFFRARFGFVNFVGQLAWRFFARCAKTRKPNNMLLQVRNLNMVFPLADDTVLPALRDVSFSLTDGDRLGIVGESGAGKSLLAQVLINLPPPPGKNHRRRGVL